MHGEVCFDLCDDDPLYDGLDLLRDVRDEEIDRDCDASVDADEGGKDKAELRDEALSEAIVKVSDLLGIHEN